MSKFYEMQAECMMSRAKEAKRTTVYLIAAFDVNNDLWSIRRRTSYEEYATIEAAKKACEELTACWSHRTIIRIDLPAKESE